jgi:ferredoxin
MSKKDGKATLLSAEEKKGKFILSIPQNSVDRSIEVGNACPVKIIKVNS